MLQELAAARKGRVRRVATATRENIASIVLEVRVARQLSWDAGELIERELQKSGTESLGFLYHLALGLGERRHGRQQQVIAPAAAATTTSFQW